MTKVPERAALAATSQSTAAATGVMRAAMVSCPSSSRTALTVASCGCRVL
jgi:hypothetical protein